MPGQGQGGFEAGLSKLHQQIAQLRLEDGADVQFLQMLSDAVEKFIQMKQQQKAQQAAQQGQQQAQQVAQMGAMGGPPGMNGPQGGQGGPPGMNGGGGMPGGGGGPQLPPGILPQSPDQSQSPQSPTPMAPGGASGGGMNGFGGDNAPNPDELRRLLQQTSGS